MPQAHSFGATNPSAAQVSGTPLLLSKARSRLDHAYRTADHEHDRDPVFRPLSHRDLFSSPATFGRNTIIDIESVVLFYRSRQTVNLEGVPTEGHP